MGSILFVYLIYLLYPADLPVLQHHLYAVRMVRAFGQNPRDHALGQLTGGLVFLSTIFTCAPILISALFCPFINTYLYFLFSYIIPHLHNPHNVKRGISSKLCYIIKTAEKLP